jgi:hypothetical protein
VPTARFLELLAHPIALDAMQSLSKGSDPRSVLAGIAGDIITQRVAEALGTAAPTREAGGPPKAQRVDDNVIDADFKVINVTPKKSATK